MELTNKLDTALLRSREALNIVIGNDPRYFSINTDIDDKLIKCKKVFDEDHCSIIHCIQPGRTNGIFHSHTREFETFICISGKGIIHYNNFKIELHPGRAINIPPTTDHKFVVETEEECEYIVVTHPKLNI